MVRAGDRPHGRADVRLESLPDGSAVLFDPATNMTYAVTASAALVWQACDGTRTPDAIVADLAEIYDAPPDRIAHDVDALLAHFEALGLLQPRGGADL